MARPTRQERIRQRLRKDPEWVREENERRREKRQATQRRINKQNQIRAAAAKRRYRRLTRPPNYRADEALQTSLANNRDAFNATQAGLDDQERTLGITYGMGRFGGSIANNPYSRAALLQRSYNQNQRAATNTLAMRGQLYSGATSNALSANQSNFQQANDALSKDYGARVSQIGLQRQEARNKLTMANQQANRQAVANAPNNFPVFGDQIPRQLRPKKIKLPKFKPTTIYRPKGNQ